MGQAQVDGLVQDCSISSALAMEILQSCTKPSKCVPIKSNHFYQTAQRDSEYWIRLVDVDGLSNPSYTSKKFPIF